MNGFPGGSGGKAKDTENGGTPDDHAPVPGTIGQRGEHEVAHHRSDDGRRKYGSKGGHRKVPFPRNGRRRKTYSLGVESIQEHDGAGQHKHHVMKAAQRPGVDDFAAQAGPSDQHSSATKTAY